jgi:hypothetical protein
MAEQILCQENTTSISDSEADSEREEDENENNSGSDDEKEYLRSPPQGKDRLKRPNKHA